MKSEEKESYSDSLGWLEASEQERATESCDWELGI